jgi:hypothetical protein
MAITITTLNNEAAVAKTFTEVSKDRSTAEWYNSTDETVNYHGTVSIKQRLTGKSANGVQLRQTLIQAKAIGTDGTKAEFPEEVFINVTINTPVGLSVLTATLRKDLMAYLRNLLTAANVDALVTGQV